MSCKRSTSVRTIQSAVVLLLLVFTRCTCSDEVTSADLSPGTRDFGSVAQGSSSAVSSFALVNGEARSPRNVDVQISGDEAEQFGIASHDCGSGPLRARATCTITVVFHPTSPGAKSATLKIGGWKKEMSAVLVGTGLSAGQLLIVPAQHDFGSTTQGDRSAEFSFSLRNSGQSATGAVIARLAGPESMQFAITANTCFQPLAAQEACTLGVRFQPSLSASAGAKASSLVASAMPGGDASTALSGTALQPGSLRADPTEHRFDPQIIHTQSDDYIVSVSNLGDVSVAQLSAFLTGTDSDDFGITTDSDTCSGRDLAGNTSCQVALHFNPSTAGERSTSLVVRDLSGDGVAVSLSGLGQNPARLTISPTDPVDMGTAVVGTLGSTVDFTVTNSGDVRSGPVSASLSDDTNFQFITNECQSALEAGGKCRLTVRFRPQQTGTLSSLVAASADPGGTATGTVQGTSVTPGQLMVAESAHAFDPRLIHTVSDDYTAVVMNVGESNTGPLAITLEGSDPGEFGITSVGDNCSGRALGPSEMCQVPVHFAPTTPGSKSASLVIRATPGGTASVALTGFGHVFYSLTVTRAGTGGGTVSDASGAIDCGSRCTADFEGGTVVTLTATHDPTSTFDGWSGACSGIGTCVVTMSSAMSVSATFTRIRYRLTVTVQGNGLVTSAPAGIACGAGQEMCAADFDSGTFVTLTERPTTPWYFCGWVGPCTGSDMTCSFTMTMARTVNAFFCVIGGASRRPNSATDSNAGK